MHGHSALKEQHTVTSANDSAPPLFEGMIVDGNRGQY
jgi:hypothetical protein